MTAAAHVRRLAAASAGIALVTVLLAGCTASEDAEPKTVRTPTSSTTGASATSTPSPAAYSAAQARLLFPYDSDAVTLADSGVQPDPLAPFDLTSVGTAVGDAHLAQSTAPTGCGIVNGLWYRSAADESVPDLLLDEGFRPPGTDGSVAVVVSVRVFPDAASASAHLTDLTAALPSCGSYAEIDTQAGTTDWTVSAVQRAADSVSFEERPVDSPDDRFGARVSRVANLLVVVAGAAPAAVDAVDAVVQEHVSALPSQPAGR